VDNPQAGQLQPAGEDAPGESPEEEQARRLDALGESLAQSRSDAINAREQSGIEQQWIEDEEFYQGIDDANRNEHSNAWRTKPPGQASAEPKSQTRSTVFPNITRPYCDAAAARISDMLLPNDDRSWAIGPTPIPDLVDIAQGKIPPAMQTQIAGMANGNQANVDQTVAGLAEQAKQILDEAKEKAKKAETRIEDWQIEGQYHAEVRLVIEDAARCGAGVLKGPIPVRRRAVALVDVDKDGKPAQPQNILQKLIGGVRSMFGKAMNMAKALIVKEEIKPASKKIDFWNFYPDGACGENIHNGAYTWERDYLTKRQLKDLKGTPGYIDSQIDRCLEEGPQKALAQYKQLPDRQQEGQEEKRFEIWYHHGDVERENLIAAGCECGEEEHPSIPAMIVMVNNRVIKAALNPLDSGDFPYDIFPWQRKPGMPWGNGVSRQGRTPQRIVTAATRNLMDNGGISAGPQIVLKQGVINPADGNWQITPRKVWYAAEDADIDDVRKAMEFFEIPSRQKELMEIIQFGMKLMEDATGLPMLLQGQQGKAPDTVGGMTLLNNNASAVLRRLARTFDDCITEPHIRRYYTWLLQYGEDEEKGDFTIDARGSTALVERDMQSQQIPELLKASGNPIFGIDPKKTMIQWLKAMHFDPKNFEFDDEKWQQIVERLSQKPQDPRMAVEQMRAELRQVEMRWESAENDKDRQMKIAVEMINERLASAELTSVERAALEKIKASLAETAMKLTTQKELSAADTAVDLHKHHTPSPVLAPPTEPAGRAESGKAFAQ
jgi:hypothetical protein